MYIVAVYCMPVGNNGFPIDRLCHPRQWAEQQARLLRAKHFEAADISGIVEELLDTAENPAGAVKSQLLRLLIHLLKYMLDPNHSASSWNRTIIDAQFEIEYHLENKPSLSSTHQGQNSLDEALNDVWTFIIRHRNSKWPTVMVHSICRTFK